MDLITIDTRRVTLYDMTRFQAVISDDRAKKALKYRRDEDRRTCICAEGAARLHIADRLGADPSDIIIETTDRGKPYMLPLDDGRKLNFNYSHSGPFVLAGFDAEREIGVDVEQKRKVTFDVMRKFCSPEETEYVGEDPVRFFEVWTLKEAYLKAKGEGLAGGLLSVEFDFSGPRPVCSDSKAACRLIRDPDGAFVGAVCLIKN